MGYRLITPPAEQPVSLAEAKAQLRVDHADEDARIEALIRAAVSYLDGRTGVLGRCIMSQTWEMTLDAFPPEEIELPLGPVQQVVAVSYIDPAGATQTVAAADYYLDNASLSAWVVPEITWPQTLPAANAVSVRFVAGTAAAHVPEAIRHAVLLMVSHFYDERSGAGMGAAIDALIAPFRRLSA